MLTDQVDPPRGTDHQHRLLQKLLEVCLNGTLLNLPHEYLLHCQMIQNTTIQPLEQLETRRFTSLAIICEHMYITYRKEYHILAY